jgi:hypothetical protein
VNHTYVDVINLQIKSIHGAAVYGMFSFSNVMAIRGYILEEEAAMNGRRMRQSRLIRVR